MMYWNIGFFTPFEIGDVLEPTHMMYWNLGNRYLSISPLVSWTDTYDVLKQLFTSCYYSFRNLEPTHMMYWNNKYPQKELLKRKLEPTHMMYWNTPFWERSIAPFVLEPTHMMYWNYSFKSLSKLIFSWTDTYDVLKLG